MLKLKLICDRRSGGQCVLVSGPCLELMTRLFFSVWQLWVFYLTRGWVCNLLVQLLLGLARAVTLGSKSHRTHDPILLSHLRFPQPWGLRSRYDWRPVSQYVLASSPPWDLRPDINSVWLSLCCLCWAPSLTRGRVCLLSVTVSNNYPSSSFFLFCFCFSPHFTRHIFYVYTVYTRPSQPRLSRADHAPSFVAYTITAI
jgi:hypothetical protein